MTILLAIATVAVPVGLVLSRAHDRGRLQQTPSTVALDGGAPTAGSLSAAAPMEHERSEAGATRAAVHYLELTEQVFGMTPAEAGDLQRSISTSASAERLGTVLEFGVEKVQSSVPGGIDVHLAPMMVRTRPQGDGWDVSIWYVQVGVYAEEIAAEQWETATYRMVWESGEWRIDDMISLPGPIPSKLESDLATPVDQLVAFLADFEGVADVR